MCHHHELREALPHIACACAPHQNTQFRGLLPLNLHFLYCRPMQYRSVAVLPVSLSLGPIVQLCAAYNTSALFCATPSRTQYAPYAT